MGERRGQKRLKYEVVVATEAAGESQPADRTGGPWRADGPRAVEQ